MKTAEELGITEQQRKNIAILAVYVHEHAKPEEFNMNNFRLNEVGYPTWRANNHCKTSACLAGHGPDAGIKIEGDDEDWVVYVERNFTGQREMFSCKSEIYKYLFEEKHVNTIKAAVKRCSYFLEFGLAGIVDASTAEAPEDYIPKIEEMRAIANS